MFLRSTSWFLCFQYKGGAINLTSHNINFKWLLLGDKSSKPAWLHVTFSQFPSSLTMTNFMWWQNNARDTMAPSHVLKECTWSLTTPEHNTCGLWGCNSPKQYISSEVRKFEFWKVEARLPASVETGILNPDSLNVAQLNMNCADTQTADSEGEPRMVVICTIFTSLLCKLMGNQQKKLSLQRENQPSLDKNDLPRIL